MFDGETFSKIHFHNNILQNVFPRGTLLNLLWHICFPYRWKLPIYKSVTVPIFHHLGQIAVERKEFPYAEPIIDDKIFEKWAKNCQKWLHCILWVVRSCESVASVQIVCQAWRRVCWTGPFYQLGYPSYPTTVYNACCPCVRENNSFPKTKNEITFDWISPNGWISVWLAALIELLPQVSSQ